MVRTMKLPRIVKKATKRAITTLALLALIGSLVLPFLSGGAAAAENDTVTSAIDSINSILPMLMSFMIIMMIFSFIGGFFSGMNKAVSKMQT